MLSPGLLQILDQVRTEFGVEVEVVNADLTGSWGLTDRPHWVCWPVPSFEQSVWRRSGPGARARSTWADVSVGERRVAVLLIETHESAVNTVVGRLRSRLGRATPGLKLPALVLGQAAFSSGVVRLKYSASLGNKWSMALNSYIHPNIWKPRKKGAR